jgi:hypothetical protein
LGKSQKIVENLGRQGYELEWILEHNNLGREFLDFKRFRENANMPCILSKIILEKIFICTVDLTYNLHALFLVVKKLSL